MKQAESNTNLEQFTVVKRAILYARVSTDEQARTGTSIDNQIEKGLKYAEAVGLHVPPEFIFREDYTGKVLDRPELNKVRALFKAGAADALIVYKPNRLDRSEWGLNLLILLQEIKSLGIELHYSEARRQIDLNNPIEALMQSIGGWDAGENHRETVKKLADGREARVKAGSPLVHGRPPYGYQSVKDEKGWHFEIIEAQAQVIRLIFQWYVFGDETTPPMSAYAIAKRLNEMGIPSRGDTDTRFTKKRPGWSRSTVGYILSSETYAGTFIYGKFNKSRVNGNYGKNPESHRTPVEVPALISRELWELAQQKKEEGKDQGPRNTQFAYLLRRQLTCKACQLKATCLKINNGKGSHYPYYRCNAKAIGCTCDLPYYSAKKVDDTAWDWLESILLDPEQLRRGLIEYQAMQAGQAGPIREELGMVGGLVAEQEKELKSALANMNAVSSPRAKAIIGQDIERIEGVLDGLEKRRESLQAKLQETTLTDEHFLTIIEFTQEVAKKLPQARKDFNKRRQIVEILNVTGEMVIENGEKIVHITAVFGTIKQRLSIGDSTTRSSEHNLQPISISARLVIG